MIAQKIKTPFNPADKRLIRMRLHLQTGKTPHSCRTTARFCQRVLDKIEKKPKLLQQLQD